MRVCGGLHAPYLFKKLSPAFRFRKGEISVLESCRFYEALHATSNQAASPRHNFVMSLPYLPDALWNIAAEQVAKYEVHFRGTECTRIWAEVVVYDDTWPLT